VSDPRNPDLTLTLRVASAATIAHEVRRFDLASAGGAELPAFTPGAHLLIQTPSGVTRRYSLCNAPHERGSYAIAVKRERGGRGGSISMVDDLAAGDVVHVSPPRNEFELAARAPAFLFIAGGIGITPIRAMVRHLQAAGDRPWRLVYLCRELKLAAFREELSQLDNVVLHCDEGDPAKSFDLWPLLEKPTGAHVYCCGPQGLMDAVRDMTGHWPSSAVHFEDFSVRESTHKPDDRPFTVRFAGETIEVAADTSILAALRARGHRVPSSCESGTCGTCRMRLIVGDVDHRDLVLSEEERRGSLMVCVSRARSPEIAIAF
jgi:phthalate 4,5-dioxygenase reductase subunit